MSNTITSFANWNLRGTMWIWFVPAVLLTFFAAWQMVKYAEGIIAKTKFGGAFVGGVLVSITTSIPELVTEIMQALDGTPATAIADDLGANALTTCMIALVALIMVRSMFLKQLAKWTKIMVVISFMLALAMTIVLYFGQDVVLGRPGKFVIGLIPIGFLIIYIIVVILTYKFGSSKDEKFTTSQTIVWKCRVENCDFVNEEHINFHDKSEQLTAKKAVVGFILFSFLTALTATGLNFVVSGMQIKYDLPQKSAGGILLSATTALPEIVALIKFAKANQVTAAVGSIIGSHIFNYALLFFGDLAYTKSPILKADGVSDVWPLGLLTTLLLALLTSAIVFGKKMHRPKVYRIIPIIIVLTYLSGWILMIAL